MRRLTFACLFAACGTAPTPEEAPTPDHAPVSQEVRAEREMVEELPIATAEAPLLQKDGSETKAPKSNANIARLELVPGGRLLLATRERVPLQVIAHRPDGAREDVSAQAVFRVRDSAVGEIEHGAFVASHRGGRSSIVVAMVDGVESDPLLVTIVAPVWSSEFEYNASFPVTGAAREAFVTDAAPIRDAGSLYVRLEGAAGDRFRVILPFQSTKNISKVERVRLSFRVRGGDVALEPSYKNSAGTIVSMNTRGTVEDGNQGDFDAQVDTAWLAGSQEANAFVLEGSITQTGTTELWIDDVALCAQFLVGINLAWLDGAYAHDFGRSFHHPDWRVAYRPDHVEALLSMLQTMNIRLIRIWVFEGCEGLHKDGREYTTGLEETFLANFDDFVFERLPKYDVKVVFMLLGAHHTVECSSPSPIADRGARRAFFDHAMLPFVARYAKSPWVWGFDLTNEAEGAVTGPSGNWSFSGVDWTTMRDYLGEAARAVRGVAPQQRISASSGWHSHENVKVGRFSGLGFNYLDFHNYDDRGEIASYASLGRGAKVIVGEAGQHTQSRDEATQHTAVSTMLNATYRGNYWGIWPWAIEYPGANNEHALLKPGSTYYALQPTPALEALARFAQSHPDLGP